MCEEHGGIGIREMVRVKISVLDVAIIERSKWDCRGIRDESDIISKEALPEVQSR